MKIGVVCAGLMGTEIGFVFTHAGEFGAFE
jgi:hypothetical protein